MPKSSAILQQRVAEKKASQDIKHSNEVWLRAIFAAKPKSEKNTEWNVWTIDDDRLHCNLKGENMGTLYFEGRDGAQVLSLREIITRAREPGRLAGPGNPGDVHHQQSLRLLSKNHKIRLCENLTT